MKELSPREALKQYRISSPAAQNAQAKMFLSMPASERMELLFYMAMHGVNIMQYIHSLVEPDKAQTTDYRDVGDSTETH